LPRRRFLEGSLGELFAEHGPRTAAHREIARQLRVFVGANSDALAKITALVD
jgi:hypothetical protein